MFKKSALMLLLVCNLFHSAQAHAATGLEGIRFDTTYQAINDNRYKADVVFHAGQTGSIYPPGSNFADSSMKKSSVYLRKRSCRRSQRDLVPRWIKR